MFKPRFFIWKNVLWQPTFKIGIAFYGFLAFIHLLDWLFPNLLEKWGFVKMIPSLSWQTWIAIGLILTIFIILEGAYRLVMQKEGEFTQQLNFVQAELEQIRAKSTELVDKYEDRFFVKMKEERKIAAQYLLKLHRNGASLETVLDFLEAPIAVKVNSGEIDAKQVYDYFHHWIFMYWQASQYYIKKYRENDPYAWGNLKALYEKMIDLEKQEIASHTGKDCSGDDLTWSKERLLEALEKEAG